MIALEHPHRYATAEDAAVLAELVNQAGEGLPLYLWESMADEGVSAWEVGAQRARRGSGSFSYRNAVVRESDERVASALIGYPLPETPEPVDYSEMPDMFVPLQKLEDLAPGTWYVNVLATYPEFRGKGYGSDLLYIAEQLANETGRTGMSLIVSDANTRARRLYQRAGYKEITCRPMVKEAWDNAGENWVLLVKRF